MNLSKNFTLEELCVTGSGLRNEPDATSLLHLKTLVKEILQPLRDLYQHPIKVNSGYRSPAVNAAANGAPSSQHCKGEAADLDCTDNAALFELIRTHMKFDQLIWEGGDAKQPAWVHVSFREGHNRGEVLRMQVVNGKKQYSAMTAQTV